MPSTTIQSRISAFEALAGPSSPPSRPPTVHPSSPESQHHRHDSSGILETPISPITAASLQPVTLTSKPSPSPSPPNLGRKTSLIDLKDWVIDEGPLAAQKNGLVDSGKTPTQPAFKTQLHAASVNPRFNGIPLISLESPPKPKPKPKPANISLNVKPNAPPQLPPRKSSYTSLKSVASSSSSVPISRRTDSLTVEHAYPPSALDGRANQSTTHVPSSSISSFHSVSLSSDTDPSTPGSVANYISTFPVDMDRNENRRNMETDSVSSLTESFEEVSTSSFSSPTTVRLMNSEWQNVPNRRSQVPPKLPERPSSARPSIRSSSSSSNPVSRTNSGSIPSSPVIRSASSSTTTALPMIPTPYVPRRSAPPPPSRSSDRSSIRSNATTQSFSSGSQIHLPPSVPSLNKRPTPVPLGVRKRYEAVFNANVLQRQRAEKQKEGDKPALLSPGEAKGRRAVGWRGLSVDLVTGDNIAAAQQGHFQKGDEKVDAVVGNEERLEGAIVKRIWMKSGVRKARLSEIWDECDPSGQGALTIDAFAKGMWRIDEELRRVQAQNIKTATSSSAMYRPKATTALPTPKLPPRQRDILR